ncbi:hypothetical protein FRC12_005870 [Ceratobasidium sp. 428]|nr:hypothetical protein FRC12_005870 [Ceratobasidium sp. 428]
MSAVQASFPASNFRFEPQLVKEEDWLSRFMEAMDSLDLNRWSEFWTDEIFCQFGNAPKQEGKETVIKFFEPQLKVVQSLTHRILRCSYDTTRGIIYQTTLLTYEVKGDQQSRKITVPGLAVIHKQPAEEKTSGMEIYVDTTPMKEVVKEVMSSQK